jgi:ribosomal protein L25 (general stress protein Ctc)
MPPYCNAAVANREFVRAVWEMFKQEKKDIECRNRCAGGMPSHLYNYEPYNQALENFRKVTINAWSQLTTDNRVFALEVAQDECNGCPDLLPELHKLLVKGPVEASPHLSQGDPMAHAESAIEKLERLYEGKKLRRREEGKERFEAAQEEDKRSKRKRGEVAGVFAHYDPGEWEVETDYEEWDDAGFPFSVL